MYRSDLLVGMMFLLLASQGLADEQIFYESSSTNFSSSADIPLVYEGDGVENQVNFSVGSGMVVTAVNATITLNGSGMIIDNETLVNFSGVFSQDTVDIFNVTWKLSVVNTTHTTLLCQDGDDGSEGTPIGTTAKKQLNGSCTYENGRLRLHANDNITLTVNLYNDGASTYEFTHYWENERFSFVQFVGWKLGVFDVKLANISPRIVEAGDVFTETCNISCIDGVCRDTNVSVETFNGSDWVLVQSGNISLNGSQANPVILGNITGMHQENFSLFASGIVMNESLRCRVNSTDSWYMSTPKNITIVDTTPPNVTFGTPTNNTAVSQVVDLKYTPSDRHLANCSLWGNFTGSWMRNNTDITPTNESENEFSANLTFGVYLWNIACTDTLGNIGFASDNRTFNVSGDVGVSEFEIVGTLVENEVVMLWTNVTNNANRFESAIVQFWEGHPSTGEQIGTNQTVTFGPYGVNYTNVSYTVKIGKYMMYVVIDPVNGTGLIIEYNEQNNSMSKEISTSLWQTYYGNTTTNFTLGSTSNTTFIKWVEIEGQGYVFVSDTENIMGISFTSLAPLGRNSSGGQNGNTLDDFVELDVAINSSEYNDSINMTFTQNGIPISEETFTLFVKNHTVPIINSTPSGNFTTGIMWDTSDSDDSYYNASEDIVFLVAVKPQTSSTNGIVDYEIHIPASMRKYMAPESTLTFYYQVE